MKDVREEPVAMLDGADGGETALDLKAKAVGNSKFNFDGDVFGRCQASTPTERWWR